MSAQPLDQRQLDLRLLVDAGGDVGGEHGITDCGTPEGKISGKGAMAGEEKS
jgi:hypothetical protein